MGTHGLIPARTRSRTRAHALRCAHSYQRFLELDARFAFGAAARARDAFGLLPSDYAAHVEGFTDPARAQFFGGGAAGGSGSSSGGGGGGGVADKVVDPFQECSAKGEPGLFLAMPHARLAVPDAAASAAAAAERRALDGGDGGWDRGVRAAAKLPAALEAELRLQGPSRVAEVQGMPTIAEMFMCVRVMMTMMMMMMTNDDDDDE